MSAHNMLVLGLVLALVGALCIALGAFAMVLGNRTYHGPSDATHRREKLAYLVGAGLIAAGMALQLLSAVRRS